MGASILDDPTIMGSTLGEAVVINGQVLVPNQTDGSNSEEEDLQEHVVTGHSTKIPSSARQQAQVRWEEEQRRASKLMYILGVFGRGTARNFGNQTSIYLRTLLVHAINLCRV